MKDKMTPTPWVAGGTFPYKGNEGYIFGVTTRPEILVCKTFGSIDEKSPPLGEQLENSKAIVSAVNNTYGVGIRPEMVPKLLDALENILLDVTPANGRADTIEIPKVTVKIIRQLIDKAKL